MHAFKSVAQDNLITKVVYNNRGKCCTISHDNKKTLSFRNNSVGSRTTATVNVGDTVLSWPTWLVAAIRKPKLLFVTEKG